jgi:hypothetical protein
MRDAISLISKEVVIDNVTYTINNFFFMPGFNALYVSLHDNTRKQWKNYSYEKLLPYIIAQTK